MGRQPGLFDLEERLAALAAKGEPLAKLAGLTDFELYRPTPEIALPRAAHCECRSDPPRGAIVKWLLSGTQTLWRRAAAGSATLVAARPPGEQPR